MSKSEFCGKVKCWIPSWNQPFEEAEELQYTKHAETDNQYHIENIATSYARAIYDIGFKFNEIVVYVQTEDGNTYSVEVFIEHSVEFSSDTPQLVTL